MIHGPEDVEVAVALIAMHVCYQPYPAHNTVFPSANMIGLNLKPPLKITLIIINASTYSGQIFCYVKVSKAAAAGYGIGWHELL